MLEVGKTILRKEKGVLLTLPVLNCRGHRLCSENSSIVPLCLTSICVECVSPVALPSLLIPQDCVKTRGVWFNPFAVCCNCHHFDKKELPCLYWNHRYPGRLVSVVYV